MRSYIITVFLEEKLALIIGSRVSSMEGIRRGCLKVLSLPDCRK